MCSDDLKPNEVPKLDPEPSWFSDDDPLSTGYVAPLSAMSSKGLPKVTIDAIPECPVVLSTISRSAFPVLVKLKAPSMSKYGPSLRRTSIDLVLVLDTSNHIRGPRLDLIKTVVEFVINNLSPSDRLSIVTYSNFARRLLPLLKMTDSGRKDAKQAIGSILAEDGTNIVDGLVKAARVLEERLHRNTAASILFISSTRDNCYCSVQSRASLVHPSRIPEYLQLLPPSIFPGNGVTIFGIDDRSQRCTYPVYTIGIGAYHDPYVLHAISDASGGTYSYIDTYDYLHDAVASCLGGLLSLVVQDLCLVFVVASPMVQIKEIFAGRHESCIALGGLKGKIHIMDLFADEEKLFPISLVLPQLLVRGQLSERDTFLLDMTCCYKDAVSMETVMIEHGIVEVHRPRFVNPEFELENNEIKREWTRIRAMNTIEEALRWAEEGDLAKAKALMEVRISHFTEFEDVAGDNMMAWILAELQEIEGRMLTQRSYVMKGGRAYSLANLSLHGYQRATTRGDRVPGEEAMSEVSNFELYSTRSMAYMLTRARSAQQAVFVPAAREIM